jgi:hypothetical protein
MITDNIFPQPFLKPTIIAGAINIRAYNKVVITDIRELKVGS